jgi:uncharacterized membrane protein YtjA (UPF0391 family)
MASIETILLIIALIAFLYGAISGDSTGNIVNMGLAFFVLALIAGAHVSGLH